MTDIQGASVNIDFLSISSVLSILGIDAVMSEKQKEVVPPSSVPPPPNTLLNDFDTISEGSSLVTLEVNSFFSH